MRAAAHVFSLRRSHSEATRRLRQVNVVGLANRATNVFSQIGGSAFFILWNPENLRNDDLHDAPKQNGNKIPSLISRICREFVNTETIFDIDEILISKVLNNEWNSDFDDLPF